MKELSVKEKIDLLKNQKENFSKKKKIKNPAETESKKFLDKLQKSRISEQEQQELLIKLCNEQSLKKTCDRSEKTDKLRIKRQIVMMQGYKSFITK